DPLPLPDLLPGAALADRRGGRDARDATYGRAPGRSARLHGPGPRPTPPAGARRGQVGGAPAAEPPLLSPRGERAHGGTLRDALRRADPGGAPRRAPRGSGQGGGLASGMPPTRWLRPR